MIISQVKRKVIKINHFKKKIVKIILIFLKKLLKTNSTKLKSKDSILFLF
jgi:hypothetical protein